MKKSDTSTLFIILLSICWSLTFSSGAFSALPANDNFTDAEEILTIGTLITGSNKNATVEYGEPDHEGNLSNSVWWKWQATESGTFYISTSGSSFDTVMAVYTVNPAGDPAVDNLALVAGNDDTNESDSGVLTSLVSLTVSAGTYYYIAVDGYIGTRPEQGNIEVEILSGDVLYDNFSQAGTITLLDTIYTGLNIGATLEAEEPIHCVTDDPSSPFICETAPDPASSGHNSQSVWWRWEAPSGGPYYFSTRGSDFDTVMAVYTGNSLNVLSPVARNNNNGDEISSIVPFSAETGEVYHIAIDGYDVEQGTVHLSIHPNTYLNDAFETPDEINSHGQVYSGSNVDATIEDSEPDHVGQASNSVWWRWSTPANGSFYVKTIGSDFDTVLAVYSGNSFTNLPLIEENDDGLVNLTSLVCFQATADTEYRIAVDGYNNEQGQISLMVNPIVTGDLKFDGILDLSDAIVGLQVLTGITPYGISTCGSLDSNTAPGLPEVIYILNELSTSP